jgi:hypothetical protein
MSDMGNYKKKNKQTNKQNIQQKQKCSEKMVRCTIPQTPQNFHSIPISGFRAVID